jgi:predicted permease
MDRLVHDLRFAVRLLWKDRSFTLTTVATLALCLAANAAIFAIVHSVLLKPLPFPDSHRIVRMFNAYPGAGAVRGANAVPDYFDRLRETDVFEEIAIYTTPGVTLGGTGEGGSAERVVSMVVSPSFFRLLRVHPHRGQLFRDEDAEHGQHHKVVLGYPLWQRLYAGRDEALGQTLRINGEQYTVMGVLPEGFHFVNPEVQLWTPAAFTPKQRSDEQRHSNSSDIIARLKSGATLEQAQTQVDALNARNLERFPGFRQLLIDAGFHTPLFVLEEDLVSTIRPTLLLLWGGVLVVLLIGCLNVANLASVRAASRTRELVTRMALGADVARIARQVVTESLVLSAIGGAAGLVLGWWALQAVVYLGLDRLPRGSEIAMDVRAVLYMLALVVAVGLVVAVLPVLALRKARLSEILREGRMDTGSRRVRLVRRVLVTTQVAFALVLLAGAGLLLASFERVLAVDTGFRSDRVLTGSVSLPVSRYAEEADLRAAQQRLLEAVRAVPGVLEAGLTNSIPFGGNYSDSVILAEGYQAAPGESLVSPHYVRVSEGYFEAMGMRLVAGRAFDPRDADGAPRVIIVDERLARKFWPGADPLGRRLYFPGGSDDLLRPPPEEDWMTVVGVVRPIKLTSLTTDGHTGLFGAYYVPTAQVPTRSFTFAVRTYGAPEQMTGAVRAAVASVDPELPLFNTRTMEERVDLAMMDRRTPMLLAVGFATVALFLSAIGIYGTLSHQVSQRRREIGIRMALGAAAPSIFGMVLREGAMVVAAGTVLGLAGAFMLRQTMEAQLFGVGALDPGVLSGVAVVLVATALAACLVPARVAARTDPLQALGD